MVTLGTERAGLFAVFPQCTWAFWVLLEFVEWHDAERRQTWTTKKKVVDFVSQHQEMGVNEHGEIKVGESEGEENRFVNSLSLKVQFLVVLLSYRGTCVSGQTHSTSASG